jgi:hypothetical protein
MRTQAPATVEHVVTFDGRLGGLRRDVRENNPDAYASAFVTPTRPALSHMSLPPASGPQAE